MNRDRTRRTDAQMGIDFLTGMSIFIVTVIFVMQMMTGVIQPYIGTSKENVGVADRASSLLFTDRLADRQDPLGRLNYTKTMDYFNNQTADEVREDLGIPELKGYRAEVTSDYTSYGPREGLVLYLPFNERSGLLATDVSPEGDANDGFLTRGVEMESRGISSSTAFTFDGGPAGGADAKNDHVRIDGSTSLNLSETQNVTVSMWVRPNLTHTSEVALLQKGDASYNISLRAGNTPEFTMGDRGVIGGALHTAHDPNFALTPGEWNHVVGVYNGTPNEQEILLYGNGEERDDASLAPGLIGHTPILRGNDTQPVRVAANPDIPDRHFNGSVDEVRIYNKALTEDEIQRLYNASGILSEDQPDPLGTPLEDTTLDAGENAPASFSSVATRVRYGYMPQNDVGSVELEVKVWE